jgi:Sec-independent protein translocase protein TatA
MSATRWGIGIGLGIIVAAGAYLLFKPDRLEQTGRTAGYADPAAYKAVHNMQTAKSIDESDLAELDKLADDSEWRIRARALSALKRAKDRTRAASIAKRKLTDPEPVVRVYALTALDRLKSPEVLAVAKTLLNDPEESVRAAARRILKRP